MEHTVLKHTDLPSTESPSMIMIKKRDGRSVPFDAKKITTAIARAGKATGEFDDATAKKLSLRVLSISQTLLDTSMPSVEEIQDIVEDVLLSSPFKVTAKHYILYRDQHARIREMIKKADVDLLDNYLKRLDWQVNENSNMDYSLQGLNNYVAGELSKVYWLNKVYTANIREAHTSAALHLHDLGLIAPYCVGWDLQDLLRVGFTGASGKAESKPPKHFRAALGQIVNFFYTLQGEAAGAEAFSNFDTLLAPFIRYDNLSYAEVRQAMQEFIFNMNVPTRVGFQTPFTNITIDLHPSGALADENVIIGGVVQKEKYRDFQAEMDLFNKAFLEIMSEGDARGRVFTFPIPTYNITKDFDWEAPSMNKLWEVTAKYGIPYFANFINADMSPDDARSMCCRLRLDLRDLEKRGGGLFGSNPLTGSIGVVTINLPQLGHLSGDETEFFKRLDALMRLAQESLETKRKIIEQFTDKNLYPYSKFYLRNIKKRFGSYWHNHFATIGIIGMNEACINLLGASLDDEKGHAFAVRVLNHMRDMLAVFQEETGNIYNLEATPAEGTSYRLARADKSNLPGIVTANEHGDMPFYTNSSQLPVDYSDDIFKVLDMQNELQTKYTGGTVQHIFLGEAVADPLAVKRFVRAICERYEMPYFSITPTFSVCPEHGYIVGKKEQCGVCDKETEVYSRIVGYLRPVKQWNEGKQVEFSMRKIYKVES